MAIQIKRGTTTFDPSTSDDKILLDGQLFYSKKDNELYVGDGTSNLLTLNKNQKQFVDKDYIDRLSQDLQDNTTILTFKFESDEDTYFEFKNGLPGMTKIDWGDGTINSELTHNYKKAGIYYCKIYDVTELKLNSYGPPGADGKWGVESIIDLHIGKTVTSISGLYQTQISNLIIPDSVTSIGSSAFYGCDGLTNIIIPNSVISIGEGAFQGCSSLTSIVIPDSVTSIGYGAFAYCSSLTSIIIPDSVTTIEYDTFRGCSNLQSMILPFVGGSKTAPVASESTLFGYIFGTSSYTGSYEAQQHYSINDSVTYHIPSSLTQVTITSGNILYGAFSKCSKLANIVIGDSVTTIGDYAFRDCISLTSVEIPNSVTSIGQEAFSRCSSLTSVVIPDSVTKIEVYTFSGCTNLTSIEIPDSITEIGPCAFYSCSSLTSVVIPEGVTSIFFQTFEGCSSLTNIVIPNSVTSIGASAFQSCSSLTSVEISNLANWCQIDGLSNITSSNRTLYLNGEELSGEIVIPNTVTEIKPSAFEYCDKITSVIIPDSVTSIGGAAFNGCSSLESITIPFVGGSRKTATDTYQYPFGYIFGTSSYEGGTGVTQIYYGSSTSGTTSSTYYIPTSLKKVTVTGGNILLGAFDNCGNLTSIEIPDSVTTIGIYAFHNCSSLTSMEIPDSVTSIGTSAFYNCSSLTSIEIPNSVTSIGDYAFAYCSSLTNVKINGDIITIIKDNNIFEGTTNLTTIQVPIEYLHDYKKNLPNLADKITPIEKISEWIYLDAYDHLTTAVGSTISIKDNFKVYYNPALRLISFNARVTVTRETAWTERPYISINDSVFEPLGKIKTLPNSNGENIKAPIDVIHYVKDGNDNVSEYEYEPEGGFLEVKPNDGGKISVTIAKYETLMNHKKAGSDTFRINALIPY